MSVEFVLKAEPRTDVGKGASRRLRRSGKVPAVMYGGHEDPQSLSLTHSELIHELASEAIYSSVLKIDIGGRVERAILRDLQRHPFKPSVLHLDLQRVRDDEQVRIQVPLHFVNEDDCVGVKHENGILNRHVIDVEVMALPGDLPEYIEIDVAGLRIGDSIPLSQLALPQGVTLVEMTKAPEEVNDLLIVSVHAQSAEADEDADETGGIGEAGETGGADADAADDADDADDSA